MSKNEAIVALAGSEGSVAEALGLLVSVGTSSTCSDFRREVVLAARLIDLSELLSFMPGLRGFLNGDKNPVSLSSSSSSSSSRNNNSIRLIITTKALRSQHMS